MESKSLSVEELVKDLELKYVKENVDGGIKFTVVKENATWMLTKLDTQNSDGDEDSLLSFFVDKKSICHISVVFSSAIEGIKNYIKLNRNE